ncbi:Mediator complex domain containing protein [Aphelenchoides fujianensis]|nr:Mediator complex domain containing protein [Aphelenchoides fujianensis]
MGVSWIFAVDQQQRQVEAALERAGAEHRGTFKVDCTAYRPAPTVQSQLGHVYLLHHSNYPDSTANFVEILSNPSRRPPSPHPFARSVSDQGFDHIIQKFSTAFKSDTNFEVNGTEFHLKDFRVRVGTVLMNNSNTKGEFPSFPPFILLLSAGLLRIMMNEMIYQFFPAEVKRPPSVLLRHRKAVEGYVLADTLEQYLLVFNEMRKRKS